MRLPRPGLTSRFTFPIGLRAKLLLVTLTITAIPLVGIGYVREIEALLREQQEQALLAAARAIATTLHDRPALLRLKPADSQLQRDRDEAIRALTGLPRATDAPAPTAESPAVLPTAESTAVLPAPDATAAMPVPAPATVSKPETAPEPASVNDDVGRIVSGLNRSGSRVWVVDRQRRLLALAGSLKARPADAPDRAPPTLWERAESALLRPLYDRILGRPTENFDDSLSEAAISGGLEVERALTGIAATRKRASADNRAMIVSAAHPVFAGNDVVGAVVVEETTNAIASFATRALEKLLTGTLALFGGAALVLLLFASSLTRRLLRLRDQAEAAVDARGRLGTASQMRSLEAGARSGDEIGDLSRSFARLLSRLAQHHDYMEQLGARLTHEFRTPITVVRSSLDNLRMQPLPDAAQVYLRRAEEGVARLAAMLSRMSEARRVEAAIEDSPREWYDLREVLCGCVEGYRAAYPQQAFELHLPHDPLQVHGSPDLLAQALDKLAANATSFAAPGTPVTVSLKAEHALAVIAVANIGPPLPDGPTERLFDSMVSLRGHDDAGPEPHLGLGLFIVRLVAQFHGGSADARNRADARGVVFALRIPESAIDSHRMR